MKIQKKFLALFLSLLLIANLFAFAGCGDEDCEHQWKDATCTKPKTCSLCNETEGEALGHTPNEDDGDCTTPIVCSVCDEILTEAKEKHTGGTATCNHKAHCSVCNKEYGELSEHTWNYDSASEEHDKSCTVCGYVAEEKIAHTHKDKLTHVEAKAATCTEAGNVEYWTCSCGKWFSDSSASDEITNHDGVVIAATAHSHSADWSENATQHWHECACGDKADVADHTWNYDSASEEHDKSCTVCGYVAEPKLGHTHAGNLARIDAKDATCSKEGNVEYWTCSCGKWFSDSSASTEIINHDDVVIAKTNHAHSSEWSDNATQHWHECTCGDKADVADHTWSCDAATEEQDKHCTVCGYVAQEKIPHTHSFEDSLSYDDEGHWYASTCGHDVKDSYATHQYTSVVTPPSCTEEGYTTYTCVCGKTYKDDYTDATDHTFEDNLTYDDGGHWYASACEHDVKGSYATHQYTSVVTPPRCTEQGYTTYTCQCGYSYVADYVQAKGHNVTDWAETSSSLYEEENCKYAVGYSGTCSDCNQPQQKTEYHEKHAWTYVVKEGKAADCQNEGTKLQFCKNEGCRYYGTAKNEDPYSDPDAHNWVMDDEQIIDGMTSYHCSVGGCNATKNVVSSSGNSANVSSENVNSLDEVALDNVTIGFDDGIKDNLSNSGSDVAISVGTLEGEARESAISDANLLPEQEALLGDSAIYDFTVTTNENVSELGGTATIRIPYTLSEGEDPDNVIVWYISEEGELISVGATYADGYVTFTTTHFSYYLATTIAPALLCEYLEHDMTNTYTVHPTCTEGGYTVCIRCGKIIEGTKTEPLGHSWHTTVISESSCTTNGRTKYECTVCDFEYETLVGAKGHYYTQKAQSSPSCTHSGSATYGCIYCDSEYTVTLPQLRHTYVTTVVAPTCEENGYTQKTCLTCGDTIYTNYQSATGHTYGASWSASPAGHYHSCITCGKIGELHAHTPGAAATENSAQICTVCEYIIVPPISHTHSLTKVEAKSASCLENGNIAYYTCECGKWFLDEGGEQLITDHSTVIVLAAGHTHTSLPHVEPTCTTVGYTAGIECSVCHAILRGHVKLSAYGHDYITTETAPTCTDEGVISKVCSVCGDRLSDEAIPKLEHKYVVKSIVAPTCTEGGYTEYGCVYCGDVYTADERSAYGHSYSTEWSVNEHQHWHECTRCGDITDEAKHNPGAEATETSAQTCTACNYVIEPIKNHTHTPEKAVEANAPTCESMGNKAYYICSCGNWYYDEACEKEISNHADVILNARGHTLVYIEEKSPTCTEEGVSDGYYCSVCDRLISGCKPLEATGHNYADGVCTGCGEADPNYVPEEVFGANSIEVAKTYNGDGTVTAQINLRNVDLAGVRFALDYSGYAFDSAECAGGSQYFDNGSAINFVFSSGANVALEELELLTVQFTVSAEMAESLTLKVIEIYRFADDGSLEIPQYEIIYTI